MLEWFEYFLTCRKQRVTIGEASSKWIDFLSEEPQGSVLGPLLFAIYINILPKKIDNIAKFFVDDSKIISVINGRMRLNVEKCKVMHFGKSNLKANYYMTD